MKFLIAIILSISQLLFGGGTPYGPNVGADADEIRNIVVNAITTQDTATLEDLFSKTVQEVVPNLREDAEVFLAFIKGSILTVSDPNEHGVNNSSESDGGNLRREIQPSFRIETTEGIYYVAVKACVKDSFDPKNIGVYSLRIVDATDWPIMVVYRGGGQWPPGISIDNGASMEAYFYREGYWES